jgi:hypothetical protein
MSEILMQILAVIFENRMQWKREATQGFLVPRKQNLFETSKTQNMLHDFDRRE